MVPFLTHTLRAVSETELKRLWRRFKKLDKDNSGTLTADEFLSVPELACNPLLERVIAIFDTNKDDEIEFKEFIAALSTFSEKGNTEAKLKFAFQIYDMDGDGEARARLWPTRAVAN